MSGQGPFYSFPEDAATAEEETVEPSPAGPGKAPKLAPLYGPPLNPTYRSGKFRMAHPKAPGGGDSI